MLIEDIDQPVSASLGVLWIAKDLNCLQVDKEDNITKTCLYNFNPLKPHFYIVKLGFTGVYINFLITAQNIDCGYSLEPPNRLVEAALTSTHTLCFEQKYEKYRNFFIWNFSFFGGKIFNIFEQACFRIDKKLISLYECKDLSASSSGTRASLRKHAYSNR